MSSYARMLNNAKTKTLGTYRNITAKDLQKAIRAEAGAKFGHVECVIDGEMQYAWASIGEVICVTCGKCLPWSHVGTHAGHFLSGRSAAIVFDERGIHPQCSHCNRHDYGAQEAYTTYMLEIYGQEVIDDLRRRKRGFYLDESGNEVRLEPQTREELVEMRLIYKARTKKAEEIISGKCGENGG